jgi:hypothetical protein
MAILGKTAENIGVETVIGRSDRDLIHLDN